MKVLRRFTVSVWVLLALLSVGVFGIRTQAAVNLKFSTKPTQIEASKNSIRVNWWAEGAGAFIVELMDHSLPASQQTWQYKARVTDPYITLDNLRSGGNYSVRVTAISADNQAVTTSAEGHNLITLIDSMGDVKVDSYRQDLNFASVSWYPLGAADGYEYRLKTNGGKIVAEGKLTGTDASRASLDFNDLTANTTYTFSVRAYMTYSGKRYETDWKSVDLFEQTVVKSVVKSGGKLKIKWSKVKGAGGYDVYVSSKPKKGYVKVKSVGKSKTSLTIKKVGKTKISKKKKWYVYVVTKKNGSRSAIDYYWTSADKGGYRYKF